MFDFFLLQFSSDTEIQKARLLRAHLSGTGGLKNAVDVATNAYPGDSDWFAPLVDDINLYAQSKLNKSVAHNALDEFLTDLFDRLFPDFWIDGSFNPELSSFTSEELKKPHMRWITALCERAIQCSAFEDVDAYLLARIHPNSGISDKDAVDLIRIYLRTAIRTMDFQHFITEYLRVKSSVFNSDGVTLKPEFKDELIRIIDVIGNKDENSVVDHFCRKNRISRFVFKPILKRIVSSM